MKLVLLWVFLRSGVILLSLAVQSNAMVIMGLLLAISGGLLWNICRVKKG